MGNIDLAALEIVKAVARVMNHEVEAAFGAEPFTADDLESAPVFSEELVPITPKGFRKVKAPRDIGRTPRQS